MIKTGKIRGLLLFVASLFAFAGFAQAKMEIKDAKKNFGFVKKGELVKVIYDIKNTGTEPLIISNIEISCSCTTADFDHKPILPGQSSAITINFDTKTVYDRQDRTVLVHSNDKSSPHKLRYKGVVLNK